MKYIISLRVSVLLFVGVVVGLSDVMQSVPMDGGMKHAYLYYRAAENRLDSMVEQQMLILAPLDVTYPTNTFDPADGWFPYLDPSRRGLSFSRQYGFDMGGGDLVPVGQSIWIRILSHTPGLEFFTYRQSGMWKPMFGTQGAADVLQWDLRMMHPAVAAPPENGTHSATFEAFLVNTDTGLAFPGVAPTQFTLSWTNYASVRELKISADKILRWSARATNYVLETATDISALTWTAVTNKPTIVEGEFTLPIDAVADRGLYRLRRVP